MALEFKKPTFFWKLFLITTLVMFIAGVIAGYGLWGKREKKPKVKLLMNEIVRYVESLEEQNARLESQLKDMKDAVEKSNQAIQSVELMRKDLGALQDEKNSLIEQMRDYTQLKEKVEELEATLKKVKEVVKKPAASFSSDQSST